MREICLFMEVDVIKRIVCFVLCILLLTLTAYADGVPQRVAANYTVNIRCGPDVRYDKVGELPAGKIAQCYGSIDGWYVVSTDDGVVGVVSGKYVTAIFDPESAVADIAVEPQPQSAQPEQSSAQAEATPAPTATPSPTPTPSATPTPQPSPTPLRRDGTAPLSTPEPTAQPTSMSPSATPAPYGTYPQTTPSPDIYADAAQITAFALTDSESEMLALLNADREKADQPPLAIDATLTKLARKKSQDMVDNDYFSHTSPRYGTPFDMLTDDNVNYSYAGENIAANRSVSGAYKTLYDSEGHRTNMLNPNYKKVGIGVVNSPQYGLMLTQIFTD